MRRPVGALWRLGLLVVVFAVGCTANDAPPSIVLISLDSVRADHIGAYGYARATPNIDALAAEGVLFEDAHSSAPWTLPAHMSLLTGRFASSHRVEDDDRALRDDVGLLSEALARAGYHTAGFVAHHYLDRQFGFARGFETYRLDQYRVHPQLKRQRRGDRVVAHALRWLEARPDDERPFLLFVHLFDAHFPYAAPPAFLGRYSDPHYAGRVDGSPASIRANLRRPMSPDDLAHLIDLYDEEILYVDHLVGELVRGIRERTDDDTVILLTADHGEEFKDHDALGHATTLYREQSHVPLILVAPGHGRPGRRVDAVVRHVDVAPTLSDLAGLDPDDPFRAQLQGTSLLRHLGEGEPIDGTLPVFFETTRWGPRRSAVTVDGRKAISPMTYRWYWGAHARSAGPRRMAKWIRGLERFDLRDDPAERTPLPTGGDGPAVEALRAWRERVWRGVLISLHADPAWRGAFSVDPDAQWVDEPRLDDGRTLYPVRATDGTIALAGLPDHPLELLLPVDPRTARWLEVESHAGSIAILDGERRIDVAPGSSVRIDLAEVAVDAAPRPLVADAPSAAVRVRPTGADRRLVVDDETRELIEQLGY